MTERVKVAEPVWSAPTGHTNALDERIQAEITTAMNKRKRYKATNDMHELSDCFNCAKGVHGVCIVIKRGQQPKSLNWCNANYEACQYWERVR